MKTLPAFLIILSYNATAQKMKLLSGSLQGLKTQASYHIKFTYDSMLVGIDTQEKVFLANKKTQWEMKEPGRGSEFIALWFNDRKELYEPAFINNFETYSKRTLNDKDAKYTLILKTKRTEGGWYGGVMAHPGEIHGELWIVDSADDNTVIAKIGFYNFGGNNAYGGDFEMTTRIQSAYVLAGKGLGDFLKRKSR